MTQDEALKLALEALEAWRDNNFHKFCWAENFNKSQTAITAIKEALAQPEQEPAIGDIRALKHRIHELEGEVIGYKQILDAQPEQEPVELLLQLRSALALASAICDAVPNRESSHLGTLVNAQPDGSHGYRQIQEAEAALVKYLETPAATLPLPVQPKQEPVAWEQFHEHFVEHNFCPRCGKRTADLTTIHTCTPPQENT